MGFFANFVNGAMNAGFNIAEGAANSAISAHYNKALMAYQSRINRKDHKWSLENSPTFQRQGLVDAGYNPILAFSQNTPSMGHVGLGSSSLGSPSAGKAFMESQQLDNAKNQLKIQQEYNKNVIANQKAEIEQKKAQTEILKEQADESKRKNLVSEDLLKQAQAETKRSNISRETETNRSNLSREVLEKQRNNIAGFNSVLGSYIDYVRSTASEYSGDIKIPGFFNGSGRWKDIPEDDLTNFMLQFLSNHYGFTLTPKVKWSNEPPHGVKLPLEHKFYPQKQQRNFYK